MKMIFKEKTNQIIKIGTVLLLGFVMMSIMSMKTYAAPKQMPDGNWFDAEFYGKTYPDLVAVFGTDETLLYSHYVMSGSLEGRLPYAPGAVAGPMTQEQIYQKLMELKTKYPEGTCIFPGRILTEDRYVGYTIQDEVFGDTATLNIYSTGLEEWACLNGVGYTASSATGMIWMPQGYAGQDPLINGLFEEYWNKLQIGDGIRIRENLLVVLTKADDHVTVVKGSNYGDVTWDVKISKEILRTSMLRVESYLW